MATVPGGILSFMYHVTYDADFNKEFEQNEEGVMEFFQIPLRLKQAIRRVSEIERGKLQNLKNLRDQVKNAKDAGARDLGKEQQLERDEEEFEKRTVVPDQEMDIALALLREELNGGVYRRFW